MEGRSQGAPCWTDATDKRQGGGQSRGSQGHWSPPRSLTSPTAFTTGRWRRPMVLNRLKTWETWVLGETVNGEGFIYGVTSCSRESKNHPQPGISMGTAHGTALRNSPPHHNHPGIQQCEIQVMYVRIPRVVLSHLRIRKAWLAGTLQFQPRHTAALQHNSCQEGHSDSPSPVLLASVFQ